MTDLRHACPLSICFELFIVCFAMIKLLQWLSSHKTVCRAVLITEKRLRSLSFLFSHQLSLQDASIGCLAFDFQAIYVFNGFCLCVTVFWRTNPPLILISQTFKASFPFRCAFTQIRSPLGPVLHLFLSILELILVQFLSESEPELEILWGVFFTLLLYVFFVGSTRPW